MKHKISINSSGAERAPTVREALENLVNHHCRNCPEDTQYGCGVNIEGLLGFKCTLLKQARTALVAHPRKGMWKNGTEYEYEYAYCSECGQVIDWSDFPKY